MPFGSKYIFIVFLFSFITFFIQVLVKWRKKEDFLTHMSASLNNHGYSRLKKMESVPFVLGNQTASNKQIIESV